jgi:hypothetical protein
MPSAAYFQRQADICLRLSLIASDEGVSKRLITMAREYMASFEALERDKGANPESIDPASVGPASLAGEGASLDGDPAPGRSASDAPTPPADS